MSKKSQQDIYHANVNVNLMEETVIEVNVGTMINADVSVKKIMCVEKNMFRILLHVIVEKKIFSKYYR